MYDSGRLLLSIKKEVSGTRYPISDERERARENSVSSTALEKSLLKSL